MLLISPYTDLFTGSSELAPYCPYTDLFTGSSELAPYCPYTDLFTGSSELKRKLEEVFVPEEVKKKRIDGDVPADLITNIVATITEPEQMVGPDVSLPSCAQIFM